MSESSGEKSSAWAKVGAASAKYGASAGKRFAQSEAGRAAGRAAVRGATQAAADEMCDRYFAGDQEKPAPAPQKQASKSSSKEASSSKSSAPPPATSSSSHSDKPHPQDSNWKENAGQKWSDFSGKVKGAASGVRGSASDKYHHWKESREPRFLGPSQTPESAQQRAQAVLARRRVKTCITEADWDKLPTCEALFNFKGELDCDLEFRKGQRIVVLTRTESQNDWWEGRVNDKTGIFPANYVKVL